jgi:hypothetical protein
MKGRFLAHRRGIPLLAAVLLFLCAPHILLAQPTPAAVAAFNTYTASVESRLAVQHRSADAFLAPPPLASHNTMSLQNSEPTVERLTPAAGAEVADSLIHHWRGTAFVAGAKAADFERLMRNFKSYPQCFSPQVLQAALISASGDQVQASMRVRQQHVITVVMDTTYDINYGQLDPEHGYSISRSTRIAEIYRPGTNAERTLSPDEEHGFLWRQNTYWSYEQKDGGLYLQIESVSLTRSIPHGLGWAIRPYIESIPRDSLEFTLRSVCNALRK